MNIWFLNKLFGSDSQETPLKAASGESDVVWTGRSIRLKNGEALLESAEIKRDLDAAARLNDSKATPG